MTEPSIEQEEVEPPTPEMEEEMETPAPEVQEENVGQEEETSILEDVGNFFTKAIPDAAKSTHEFINENVYQPTADFVTETIPNAAQDAH